MNCKQAQQLFDAYLEGELSDAQMTELGAHRVKCPACRRDLALLEVTDHILAVDVDPVWAPEDFSDRLLACMKAAPSPWKRRMQRMVYVGAPLAAAAVIALAFLGLFDAHQKKIVAGKKVTITPEAEAALAVYGSSGEAEDDQALDEWLDQEPSAWLFEFEKDMEALHQGSEQLKQISHSLLEQLERHIEQAQENQQNRPPVDEEGDDLETRDRTTGN